MKKLLMVLSFSLVLIGCSNSETAALEEQIEELKEENEELRSELASKEEEAEASIKSDVEEVKEEEVAEKVEEEDTNDTLQFGKQYIVEGFAEFTIDEFEFVDEILPPNTSSVYSYYELNNSNNIYLLLTGEIKNLSTGTIDTGNFSNDFSGTAFYKNDFTYDNVRFGSPTTSDSNFHNDRIDPLEDRLFYIYVEVPKEVSDNIRDVEMEIEINRETFYIQFD
ncbi:hypothetical protein LGQ02_19395 [Bacillus shivajii]|uniref:hypothetical protein n=1 Tax=Bacillus shivajii TaxID=1983719 RepID=UPI001CF94EAB|nr:hypothetical protein [Bacillus shivajii]UCZ52920.1 hypothetical protein LGQ02_19395 [Bacillus shivajii]